MAERPSLLPANATPLQRAVEAVGAARRPLSSQLLAAVWDPWTVAPGALPYLAAAVRVPIWDPAWPTTKLRQVTARTIALSRRRGTVPAFETFLGFIDAQLVEFRGAPQTLFPRDPRTPAEREAWAAQFPELRIYTDRSRHERAGALIPGRPWGGSQRFVRDSLASAFAGRRAVLVVDGVEQPASIRVTSTSEVFAAGFATIGLRAAKGRRFFPGATLSPGLVARATTAGDRVFSLGQAGGVPVVPASAKPIEATPKLVRAPAPRLPGGLVVGRCWFGRARFARRSRAVERSYESFRLYDRTLAKSGTLRKRGGWFLGRGRLGQPPFHLELSVDLTRKAPLRRRFPFKPTGFLHEHDGRRTADALAAIRAAKLGRDKVLVRTGLHRPVTVGDRIRADGSVRVGQINRSL